MLEIETDTVADSLVHARWRIQKTAPIQLADLDTTALDLRLPENIKQEVEYDDSLNVYKIGSKMGDTYLNTPLMLMPDEFLTWSERREREAFFRKKDAENVAAKGKEKFDFTDMHFDLGPAEKIFGPGGVRIKTQGTAELKLGATLKNIDNPSLPERNRKTTAVDFDEKINLNVTGKVGDKVNMSLNYNTDATFDFPKTALRGQGRRDHQAGRGRQRHLPLQQLTGAGCLEPLRCAHRYAVWQAEAADCLLAEELDLEERLDEGRHAAEAIRARCGQL